MNSLLLWQILASISSLSTGAAIIWFHKLEEMHEREVSIMMREQLALRTENERLRDCLAKMQPYTTSNAPNPQ